jgi:protein SCO1/2
MKIGNCIYIFLFSVFFISCNSEKKESEKKELKTRKDNQLPIFGHRDLENGDTVYHTVPDFIFMNQDSMLVKSEDLEGKIIIANFFFSSCPSICPVMTKQMKRLQVLLENDSNKVVFLSHTIDPDNDNIERLKKFSERYEANTFNWHFLRGDIDYLYDIAKTGYLSSALIDDKEPGGFLHSPYFVLVDKERRIRGMYDGTIPTEVDKLAKNFVILIKEYETK